MERRSEVRPPSSSCASFKITARTEALCLCREEVRLLKEELTEEYDTDKQVALTQLSQQKELEMMAARESWQRKVEDLLEQVRRCFHEQKC